MCAIKKEENHVNNRIHILVVDDDKAFLMMLHTFIIEAGYECSIAENTSSALDILKVRTFDIVLSDIQLPEMNGIELTKRIKKKYECDVIIMTGYIDEFKFEDAVNAGAGDFIQKPFSEKELIARVKRILNERSLLLSLKKKENELEQKVEERTAELKQEIENHKSTEKGLRNSEANLKALIENADDRIWSIDAEYHLICGNLYFYLDIVKDLKCEINEGASVFLKDLPRSVRDEWRGSQLNAL